MRPDHQSFFGPLLVDSIHYILGTKHNICCFGDALTVQPSKFGPHQIHSDSVHSPNFPVSNWFPTVSNKLNFVHLLPNISCSLTGAIVTRLSMLFTSNFSRCNVIANGFNLNIKRVTQSIVGCYCSPVHIFIHTQGQFCVTKFIYWIVYSGRNEWQ